MPSNNASNILYSVIAINIVISLFFTVKFLSSNSGWSAAYLATIYYFIIIPGSIITSLVILKSLRKLLPNKILRNSFLLIILGYILSFLPIII